MWIILGTKLDTERVQGGARVTRACEHCGEEAVFYERRAISKLTLYFFEVLDYAERRVMACGACGTLYGTDEVQASALPAADEVTATAKRAAARLGDAAREGWEKLREAGERARGELVGKPGNLPAPPARDDGGDHDDPLAEDDAALEAKFKDLEKKYRVGD